MHEWLGALKSFFGSDLRLVCDYNLRHTGISLRFVMAIFIIWCLKNLGLSFGRLWSLLDNFREHNTAVFSSITFLMFDNLGGVFFHSGKLLLSLHQMWWRAAALSRSIGIIHEVHILRKVVQATFIDRLILFNFVSNLLGSSNSFEHFTFLG